MGTKKIIEGKKHLKNAISNVMAQKYTDAQIELNEAETIFRSEKSMENISIAMSISALIKALTSGGTNKEILSILRNDY